MGSGPVSEDAFSSLRGEISIYLSNNCLEHVPRDLFDLSNIQHLSLRNNNLTKIPSSIRRLKSLRDLHLGCNQLKELPWELIWLMKNGKLENLSARQNPLPHLSDKTVEVWRLLTVNGSTRPEDAQERGREPSSPRKDRGWPRHVISKEVTYYNEEGHRVDISNPRSMGPAMAPSNNVPSLRELALREVCKLPDLENLTDEEISQYPPLVAPLIRKAIEARLEGGRICSVCERPYVIPRTEWTEWWDLTFYGPGIAPPAEWIRPMPFKRYGCSPSCAPLYSDDLI